MADLAIRTHALTKQYGSVVALDSLDLEVRAGEIFGYLGPNGAGKTTTLRLLLGLLFPTSGGADVLGLDPWSDAVALHRKLAYVPGDFAVWPSLTGDEMLELLGNLHGGYDRALRADLCERLELDPSRKGRTYSKGNRQKVALVAALMTRADLLVLDEPTSGLDPLMERRFRDILIEVRDDGRTVLLSSHILSEVDAVCDRVGILRAGRLVEVGALSDLRIGAARHVEVTFGGKVPDLSRIAGVDAVRVDGNTVRLSLTGEPTALLKSVARHRVVSLVSTEMSLEEIFLTYYGDGAR